jgi:hypothetical protein
MYFYRKQSCEHAFIIFSSETIILIDHNMV